MNCVSAVGARGCGIDNSENIMNQSEKKIYCEQEPWVDSVTSRKNNSRPESCDSELFEMKSVSSAQVNFGVFFSIRVDSYNNVIYDTSAGVIAYNRNSDDTE